MARESAKVRDAKLQERFETSLSAAVDEAHTTMRSKGAGPREFAAYAAGFRKGWAEALRKPAKATGFVVLAASLALSAACGSSPLEPTSDHAPALPVDARLQAAWELAHTLPANQWTNGKTMAEWLDSLSIRAIKAEPMPQYSAMFYTDRREIIVNESILISSVDVLASILIHEARHAQGIDHTCGNNDQTFNELGAWAVHALALEAFGRDSSAIRANHFCEVKR